MQTPQVSVVMGVFNGEQYLAGAVESVLSQEGVPFELIAVDDGSTDESAAILEGFAGRDSRVRVLRQPNRGLTHALVNGCAQARGTLVARQDADDISLPGRLVAQAKLLADRPDVTLAGCWTRFIGPEEEELGLWDPPVDATTATAALRSTDLKDLRGLGGHGSAMFRRADYVRAGGYRPAFYYAQDLDLWLRLTDSGNLALVPSFLYCWRITPTSITGRARPAQMKTTTVIMDAARRRQRGEPESPALEAAALIRPSGPVPTSPRRASLGPGYYFIGKLLLDRRDPRAVRYLRLSASCRPWHLPSWLALALALTRAATQ